MKLLTKIYSIITAIVIISSFAACNNNTNDNINSTISSDTVSSDKVSTAESPNIVKKSVSYRIYINDMFKETPIETIMLENNGFLPKELGETSFKVNAYTYIDSSGNNISGDLIIAENTTDKLNSMNKFTANSDFTEATFTSDIETKSNTYNSIKIATKVNDSGELCLVLDADNVIAIEE